MIKLVVVIPVYQHGEALKTSISKLVPSGLPLIVVNDGSDQTQSKLIVSACNVENVSLIVRHANGGKGAAVIDGLREADRLGYSHAFQIDSDGQHDLSSLQEFIDAAEGNSDAMILGYPVFDESMPFGRRLGRWLTHIWVWINCLSLNVRDSMCGYRIYPIGPVLSIIDASWIGRHMDFDPELCVRVSWKGMSIINLPVKVIYPEGGKSNFRMGQDNFLISLMHTRLFLGMLLRLPLLLFSRVCRRFNPGRAR